MGPISDSRNDGIVVIVLILVVLAGFIAAFYGHTQGINTHSLELTEGETTTVVPPIDTTLESVSNSGINVTIIDTEISETNSTDLLPLGDTATLTLRSTEINVTYTVDPSNNQAVISYEIPTTYAWDNIAVLFVGSVGMIVIGLFLYIILLTLNFGGNFL